VTFWGFVIVCGIVAAVELALIQWWDMKQEHNKYGAPRDPKDRQLTLQDLLIGVAISVCPLINFLVAAGCAIYIFSEVLPRIVIAGPRKS
jgi:hypothetical protein